jgi:hypothetical protein
METGGIRMNVGKAVTAERDEILVNQHTIFVADGTTSRNLELIRID